MVIPPVKDSAESRTDIDRIEKKFIFHSSKRDLVMKWILEEGPLVTVQHPAQTVSSLYFDTLTFSAYSDNLDGVPLREKVRLRWYSNLKKDSVQFEIKSRHFNIGNKLTIDIADKNLRRLCSESFFSDFETLKNVLDKIIDSDLIDSRVKFKLANLSPLQVVSYDRNYFHCSESGIRITVDTGINYQYVGNDLVLKDDWEILELKYDATSISHRDDLLKINNIKNVPLINSRNSKYCRGLSLLSDAGANCRTIERYIQMQ